MTLQRTKWYSLREVRQIAKSLSGDNQSVSARYLCDNLADGKANGGYGMNIASKIERSFCNVRVTFEREMVCD